ncbi:MAG: hypothetical protein QM482_09165 [Sulfurospirillum sp.]
MTTFFIGKVDEVRPISRKDKTTGQVNMSSQLTATFETIDNDNYTVKSTENISFPIDLLGALQQTKGKYIVVPYMTISAKSGTYTFPDDNLSFQVFDKNPLEQIKK